MRLCKPSMTERHQQDVGCDLSSRAHNSRHGESNTSELPAINTHPEQSEAIELQTLSKSSSHESLASISSDEVRTIPRRQSVRSVSQASSEPKAPFRGLKQFWSTHVVLTVSHSQNQDHSGECGSLSTYLLGYPPLKLGIWMFFFSSALPFLLTKENKKRLVLRPMH
jgi:hypothetical protein